MTKIEQWKEAFNQWPGWRGNDPICQAFKAGWDAHEPSHDEAIRQFLRQADIEVLDAESAHQALARARTAAPEKRFLMLDCARAVCAYCADEDNWQPAEKGTDSWWHLSAHGFNVRNPCSAWAIHQKLESAPTAIQGQCPKCTSWSKLAFFCTIRHPNGMHSDHDGDCPTCTDPWHSAAAPQEEQQVEQPLHRPGCVALSRFSRGECNCGLSWKVPK